MIHLRAREWGAAEWTTIRVEGELEAEVTQILSSALDTCPLHVQRMNGDGTWEDLS